jgi:hypothetical protein
MLYNNNNNGHDVISETRIQLNAEHTLEIDSRRTSIFRLYSINGNVRSANYVSRIYHFNYIDSAFVRRVQGFNNIIANYTLGNKPNILAQQDTVTLRVTNRRGPNFRLFIFMCYTNINGDRNYNYYSNDPGNQQAAYSDYIIPIAAINAKYVKFLFYIKGDAEENINNINWDDNTLYKEITFPLLYADVQAIDENNNCTISGNVQNATSVTLTQPIGNIPRRLDVTNQPNFRFDNLPLGQGIQYNLNVTAISANGNARSIFLNAVCPGHANNVDANNVDANNVDANNVDANNVDANNVDANNVDVPAAPPAVIAAAPPAVIAATPLPGCESFKDVKGKNIFSTKNMKSIDLTVPEKQLVNRTIDRITNNVGIERDALAALMIKCNVPKLIVNDILNKNSTLLSFLQCLKHDKTIPNVV